MSTGPGKVFLKEVKATQDLVEIEVHLYNFDVDVAVPLKGEHQKFLAEKIIPALTANRKGSVRLHGSASRTGEDNHNLDLSGNRAAEVQKLLTAGGVGGQIKEVRKLGEPPGPGPSENDHDRAVFIFLSLPLTLEDVDLWTDDWNRKLVWDDIVGLDGIDSKRIKNNNLQIEVSGAPREWTLDGGSSVKLMPVTYILEALGTRSGSPISRRLWNMSPAAAAAQPGDPMRTLYRLSDNPASMGFVLFENQRPGVATVNREKVPLSLGLENQGWTTRGEAEQGVASAVAQGLIDSQRLLKAGGVEVLVLTGTKGPKWLLKWLMRSPADVFFYSGNGTASGCLSRVGECWASPKDLQGYWKNLSAMKALIVMAPKVMEMSVHNGFTIGGPGTEWAKLLTTKGYGGPFTAILGYADDAPTNGVAEDIARKMGEKIAAGLSGDQWVDTWLEINGDHPGKNTWNAVGMDQRGYQWIEDAPFFQSPRAPWKSRDKYSIGGPAIIV